MLRKKKNSFSLIQSLESFLLLKRLAGMTFDAIAQEFRLFDRLYYMIMFPAKKPKAKTSSKRKAGASEEYDYIAYRFCGHPDSEQQKVLNQNIGASRWMWNRLKADDDDHYREMGFTLKNTPADYKDVSGLEWLKEADSLALANVQLQYERAKSDWLSGEKGRPRFHKKHQCPDTYTTNKVGNGNNVALQRNMLSLPKVPGGIRLSLHRKVQPGGMLKSVTVTHEPDGKWYFSILMEYPKKQPLPSSGWQAFFETGDIEALRHLGLDMSLPFLYVDSENRHPFYELNGQTVEFSKAYRKLERRIAREQRKLSHMVRDSRNHRRQMVRIAKLHAKAKHQRNDFLNQITCRLAENYDILTIEDLDMSAMKQSLKFGKSVSDNGWGSFVRLLEDKCEKRGCLLIRVDKWFPSSKTCIHCGHIHHGLKLGDRTYVCPSCGHVMDRDWQAATTIDGEGLRLVKEMLMTDYLKIKQPLAT